MKERIQTLDGLRFLAALGVLWTHSWDRLNNPKWMIGKFDLANIMALGVNGVDLFFVISGFCMYYFYGSKPEFSIKDFYTFLKRRWIRLSPVFYFATLFFCIYNKFLNHLDINIFLNVLHSIFYLNYIGIKYTTQYYFWTLTVEWQFYFIIPIIMLYQYKFGFKKIFSLIFGGIFLIAVLFIVIEKNQYDYLSYTILYRAIEFGCGVLVARILLNTQFSLKYRTIWSFIFIAILFTGRILVSKQSLNLSINYGNLIKLCGFALMGIGFAGILYLSITSVKFLHRFLGNRFFRTMGKISYSFYIWHGFINLIITEYFLHHFPTFKSIGAPILATIIGTIILYPISLLSYNFLEKPFLNIKNNKQLEKAKTA